MIDCQVLYLHPSTRLTRPGMMVIPAGLIGVLNELGRRDYEVIAVNQGVELVLNPDLTIDNLLESLTYQVLLLDLHWYVHSYSVMRIAAASKQIHPQATIIIGGLTASLYAQEILTAYPDIDYVVRGEAELALPALLDQLLKPGSSPELIPGVLSRAALATKSLTARMPVMALDSYDYCSMNWLQHEAEYYALATLLGQHNDFEIAEARTLKWLLNGRGCWFACSFCGGGRDAHWFLSRRSTTSLRSPVKTLEDLTSISAQGIDQVALTHDPACCGREYWQALLSGVRAQGLHLGIYNEFWGLPTPEFLVNLAASFNPESSILAFSPLTGDDRLRRIHGKSFSTHDFQERLQQTLELGFRVFIYFNDSLPGDTSRTNEATLRLLEELFQVLTPQTARLYYYRLMTDPCSPLQRNPERYGRPAFAVSFKDYYQGFLRFNATNELPENLYRPLETLSLAGTGNRGECSQTIRCMIADWLTNAPKGSSRG